MSQLDSKELNLYTVGSVVNSLKFRINIIHINYAGNIFSASAFICKTIKLKIYGSGQWVYWVARRTRGLWLMDVGSV